MSGLLLLIDFIARSLTIEGAARNQDLHSANSAMIYRLAIYQG
jgi:hypothetical protein